MTRRRDIERHRRSLDEIHDIMNAMKNLSFMETRKISGFLDVQHSVVKHIETVAADFLSFYPDTLAETTGTAVDDVFEVYLLIGTERGFCGDFNHVLLRHFEAMPITHDMDKLRLICIGHKLETLLQNEKRAITFIDGASVAEEVGNVLNQIVKQLDYIQEHSGSLNLYVLYHDDEHQLINQQLLPPFQNLHKQVLERGHQSQEPHAPELNLEPREFLLDLSYHYLFVILYEILYTSLMAESQQRVMHLDGAVQHMDEQSEELHRQSNILRQEEIIEEIEVILLSAVSLDEQLFQA
ncbi:MAG: F0F1 ATP synthase subunit gamma [Gammaproteobacteria bacterium]|nr:MAG: F0F1 ATP synthase subunit gamma [Gammaproteobacteria bacterium]